MKPVMPMTGRIILLLLTLIVFTAPLRAAPSADLWPYWRAHDAQSSKRIDHSPWDDFVKKYVFPRFGNALVNYKGVTAADRSRLTKYLQSLAETPVSGLNQNEQRAFWINLYNALTSKVILDHYPVETIRDIDISPGLFSNGPWDKKLIRIEGQEVSLNDIEHRILRPIWRDPRLHYVLNCAAKGCPQLERTAFTAENSEKLLDVAAARFINNPRGVHFRDRDLIVSSIFDWYADDFGRNDREIIKHLMEYAEPALRDRLAVAREFDDYQYDWSLNELP